jgi:hypothetical protein
MKAVGPEPTDSIDLAGSIDLTGMSTDRLEEQLVGIESARTRLAALEVAVIAEADRRQVPLADGCRTTAEWVAGRLDIPAERARLLTRLAVGLGALPATAERLSRGETSLDRAALVAAAATPESEEEWWERLRCHDLAGAARVVRRHRGITRHQERRAHADSYVLVQPSLDESWWNLSGGLAGIAGQVVSDALRTKADEFPRHEGSLAHRQALALEALCAGEEPPGPHLTAFFDLDAAAANPAAGAELAWGPTIGPDAVEEILCNGRVRLVGTDQGRPIVTSNQSGGIPPAVRDFVKFRDGGCRAPGCDSRHRLQVHHIVPRSAGGTHHPDDLITMCWYHHNIVVHRRGMKIETQPDGSIRFLLPADTRAPP